MSFVNARLDLPRTPAPQPLHKFRQCSKCNTDRPPEGGVQMNPTRWVCANCWTLRATRKPRNSK